jgi:RNA polymerase sigma-54 factor
MFVSHSLEQKHHPTAHLATTMSFLQLAHAELEARLLEALDKNPALELVEELRCPECGRRLRKLPCPSCAAPRDDGAPVVFLSPRESGYRRAVDDDDEWALVVNEAAAPERLDEYLLRQIGPALEPSERPIAAYLLARLNEDGLLPETTAEAAAFQRVRLCEVERVLALIQHADPPGVGARTPQESLLLQLECLAETAEPASQPPVGAGRDGVIELAQLLVRDHFQALGRMEYARLARAVRCPLARVEEAVRFIQRNLTPYPALAAWGEGRRARAHVGAVDPTLRQVDVNISMLNREAGHSLMVEVFTPLSGWLRVNPEFAKQTALAECDEADREKWSRAVMEANLVAKCVQQRNHTMRRLMQFIAAEQRAFILGGDGDLLPCTRAQIARALGVHESTISRAVAGKCAALPDGRIVPLARFFDRSLSVRDRVRLIVAGETRPLTDDQIVEELGRQGVHVARRTVAKYRKMLGLLPAALRGRQAASRRCTQRARRMEVTLAHQHPR